MKRIFVLFVVGFLSLFFVSMNAEQDSNVVWSTYIWPVNEIFNHPDSNFIFINQNQLKRFSRIDTKTGIIVDSIYSKGSIIGLSSDNKFLYTGGNTIQSIKKLDIDTYQTIDSVKNAEDITGTIGDMKLTNDGRIIVSIANGKHLFIVLNAHSLDIIYKKLIKDVSDTIDIGYQLAVSPKNNYFVLFQSYKYMDSITHISYNWYSAAVWDMINFQPTNKILFKGIISQFYIFAFSHDGKYFFMRDSVLKIFDTKDFSIIKTLYATIGIDFSIKNNNFIIGNDPYPSKKFVSVVDCYNYSTFEKICSQNSNSERSALIVKYNNDENFIYTYDALNAIFTKSKSCLNYTGMKQPDINSNIQIIQNDNNLLISNLVLLDKIYPYKITDLQGYVKHQSYVDVENGYAEINIQNLATGSYFLTLGNITYKFMVVR